jgi:hypothetical protein
MRLVRIINPLRGVQFAAGAILQHSATPAPLIEHEDEHEHEDDFDAPGEDRVNPLA